MTSHAGEAVTLYSNTPVDIYTLSGICIKRNASKTDIDNLTPGRYIINGLKVAIKKK